MNVDTEYAATDFDLESRSPFDTLQRELADTCCLLHYSGGTDGWSATVESNGGEDCTRSDAIADIRALLDAIEQLSSTARQELAECHRREFNLGFHCWDSWAFVQALPADLVRDVAQAGCSIAVTLYPMRHPDGTPRA